MSANMRSKNISPFFLLMAMAFACGPDQITQPLEQTPEAKQFAQAICGAREACGCEDSRYASADACETEIAATFDTALADGGVLDESCFEMLLANELLQGCLAWPVPEDFPYACKPINGPRTKGQTCRRYNIWSLEVSDCAKGLRCWGGTCEDESGPFPPLQEGDPCFRDRGCGVEGLYCGQADHRCHVEREQGEACDDYMACELYSYCKGLGTAAVGTCTLREAPGQPCNPADLNACETPPEERPDENYWCNPATSTCEPDAIMICRWTHPVVE